MESREFAYWLTGFFEISDAKKLDETQVQIIKDHLDLVFNKVTPDRNIEHHPQIENYDTLPFEFDLMPKVYCSTSSTFDSPFHNKKVC
jgi:hypothetical protein